MQAERALPTVTPDADYVLAVLRDEHRFACDHDPEADAAVSLELETAVADWRHACDLLPWRPLAHALAGSFCVRASDAEWRAVLEPAEERRLGDVCSFIARRTRRILIRPIRIAGVECLTAGAFLTLRTLLHRRGVDVSGLRPSTPISEVLRLHTGAVVDAVRHLRPGVMPAVNIVRAPLDRALDRGIAISLAVVATSWIVPEPHVAAVLAGAGCVAMAVCASIPRRPPVAAEMGSLRTFGDLVQVLVAE